MAGVRQQAAVRELVALLVLMVSSIVAHASAPPAAFMIDGKPVDPGCLMPLANGDSSRRDPIDLRKCSHDDIVIKRRDSLPGMVGFDYDEKNFRAMRQPYFYYKYLGRYDGHAVLFFVWSGGGTGNFTDLVGVDRNGFVLTAAAEIAGGDRCNGGLNNASLSGGKLTYDQAITPIDLIGLSGTLKLDASKDLESSAMSCVATVHNQDGHWTSVTLSLPDLEDRSGWTEQYRYQSCFNGVYRRYLARHETELDRQGVTKFAQSFVDSCDARK